MQKTAFQLQLMHFLLENIFNCHKFLILLYRDIECLFQQLIIKLFFLKKPNKLFIRLYSLAAAFLLLLLFFLIDASDGVINLHLIFLLILFQDFLHICVFIDDNVFHLSEEVEVFLHLLTLVLVVVLFLDEIGDELVDVLISDLLFEAMQLIVHGRLRQIFVFFESLHNRSERFLLIMQVFPQINDFILKLTHPLMVKLLVFQSHLLLHQQSSIDVHVLVVILPQFIGKLCLCIEQIQAFLVATHNSEEGLLIECQILLQIREIMVTFDSFSLEELDFVLLALVGSEELLDIVDVAITHQIILKMLGQANTFTQIKRQATHYTK